MAEASPTPIIETAPEEWRSIRGFEGVYEVSNHGSFRRLRRRTPHWDRLLATPTTLKTTLLKIGYLQVSLWHTPLVRKEYVHTIVAETFIGPRPPGHEVAHLDGNRANPVLSNLAYVTPTENNAHKIVHGSAAATAGPGAWNAKLTAGQAIQMREFHRTHRETMSMSELGQMFGVSRVAAHRVCRGLSYRNL